jgi:N-acyl-D-amino-acid deacylase
LMYSPGESAPFAELERLCRVVARRGKLYATHMRDYGTRVVEAVEEQIELARRTGCRLQISHFQAAGQANWSRQSVALEKIERARSQGIDVAFDCYPYICGSTVLSQLLPQSALEGGYARLAARLTDPPERARIARETVAGMVHRWTELSICAVASAANQPLVGLSIQAIAELRGREPIDVVLDLLVDEQGGVNMLEINQSFENLRQTLTHPLCNIISDGFYVSGRPHPRLHGTFAEWLGGICREKRWLGLPEAIRKITSLPAERFGLGDRGRIEAGRRADLVVFDPARVGSPATYESPEQAPQGIYFVLRDGQFTVRRPPEAHVASSKLDTSAS